MSNKENKLKRFWLDIKARIRPGVVKDPNHADEPLLVKRTKRRPLALSIVFTSLRLFIAVFVLIAVAGGGLVLGVAKAYVDTTPELDITALTKSDRTSYIYDKNGDLITTFAGMEYRDWVDIEDVPDMLKNAVVAVEDVRFYKHEGLDYKRLFSAVINTLRNQNTHGGSTITQQLIKNKILSNVQSYKRKIQEAYLAVEVEKLIEKDEILEAYLNDVFLGESNYGVKTAAKDLFGKQLSELTIRECAMLAGMIQKPYETDPRANMYKRKLTDTHREALKSYYDEGYITLEQYKFSLDNDNRMYITDRRTNIVLESMYDNGLITREQYNAAMSEQVTILETSEQKQLYDMPHFVEYAIYDVVTHLLEQREMLDTKSNRSAVENELRTGGYHIYTTVDPEVQNTVQETLSTWENYPELANPNNAVDEQTGSDGKTIVLPQPQSAAVVMDYHTGELRAVVGSRDTPTSKKQWNRAYQSATMVGSSIKPIAVYGPALDLGLSPADVIMNFAGKIEGFGDSPNIGDKKWIGPVSVRRGVISSLNVVATRVLFDNVTTQTSRDYLVNLGVNPEKINADGPGLALGTSGITPIEMAAAYAAIANTGEYLEPLAFVRVVDSEGNVVISADEVREKRQVFKPSTAYMLIDMLTDAVNSGTGTRAKISGLTVAGKTGTNDNYESAYFAGVTPYYSAVVFVGHDQPVNRLVRGSTGGKVAAPIWKAFMEKVHRGLSDRPIIDASPGELGLVKKTVCSISGKLATDACRADAHGHTPITDWYAKENAPTETCDMHIMLAICTSTGKQATYYCPNTTQVSKALISSASPYAKFEQSLILQYIPNAIFTDIPITEYGSSHFENSAICPTHTSWWNGDDENALDKAINEANKLINQVRDYLSRVQNLPANDRTTLENGIDLLNSAIASEDLNSILFYTEQLKYNLDVLKKAYPPLDYLPGP